MPGWRRAGQGWRVAMADFPDKHLSTPISHIAGIAIGIHG
jgi:hypothetical protein